MIDLIMNTELGFLLIAFVFCFIIFIIGFLKKKKDPNLSIAFMILSPVLYVFIMLMII